MAEIRAFAGLRYRTDLDLSLVTCPPYDVLSPTEQAALQDRSPFATARLILPIGEGDSRYEAAASLFRNWMETNVLAADPELALYVTRTEFTEPGTSVRRSRLGLISLLRLHGYEDRVVLPHEHTLTGPKADRLKLLQATNANFESIMGLVDDPGGELYAALAAATTGVALADFYGDDDQRHQLFAITDPAEIARISALLAPRAFFIADGHHRYETSVAFAKERGVLGTDAPEAFLLTTISTFSDPGLCVLPTHRLVRDTPPELRNLLFRHLEPNFDILENVSAADLEGRLRLAVENQPIFGLAMPSGTLYQLTLRDPASLASLLPPDVDASLRNLEVVILQHLVLDQALGIPTANVAKTNRLAYTRDMADAIRRVHDGEFDLALLLGRPAVTAVRNVSLAGEVMPQKSTFFYPKLLSGLVMRRF